eukprot:s2325_g20.t1
MAEVPAFSVQPDAPEMVCKLCNRKVAATDGRQHGKTFRCSPCASIERTMHRNLGTTAEIGTWSSPECHAFFQKLKEEKKDQGNLQWATIRALLVCKMTERKITTFAATTEVTPLPLSVLLAQGWEEEVVKRFESETSETYGVEVYKVPITKFSWKDIFESVEEKVLQQEKEASKRKGAKRNQDEDMDVPVAAGSGGKEKDNKSSEKKELQELRKRTAHNAKVAAQAAKAMGPLATAEASLTKLLAKADGKEGIDQAALTLCQEKLAEVTTWGKECRSAVNAQDKNKALPAHEAQERLEDLPFAAPDLKATLSQITEGQKAVKLSMPKAAAAPKKRAKAADGASAEAAENDPPSKRRRTKGSA